MFTFSDKEKVVNPDGARTHSIMIFDDVICDKQTAEGDYFCMGRHKHIDSSIYVKLTQKQGGTL